MVRFESNHKNLKINPNLYPEIIKQLEAGATYKSLGIRYRVSFDTIKNISMRMGKSSNWRRIADEELYQKNKNQILKRLEVLPNVKKVLSEFGVSHHRFYRDGIDLGKTKEFLKGKASLLFCKNCRVSLNGNRWHKRLLCLKCGRKENVVSATAYVKFKYHSDPEFRKKFLAENRKRAKLRKKTRKV